MELFLVVPLKEGEGKGKDDKDVEELDGKLWTLSGPHKVSNSSDVKFHCVSYVWGHGREEVGAFFDNKIRISDHTKPALEAAIRAVEVAHTTEGSPKVEAFWIDAICVPQTDQPSRYRTLESMGFIYNAAASVIVIIQDPAWSVIITASEAASPEAISYQDMQYLELDSWVSSVWTYQELVNQPELFFAPAHPEGRHLIVEAQRFFNCVGFSLHQWKKDMGKTASDVLDAFPRLNTMEDTLADREMAAYLKRTALSVLSNMALRTFDSSFPGNRLLASLGALTQDVSWGPPSTTLSDLSEKVMSSCEAVNDYSFTYTTDIRDDTPGLRWRPSRNQVESDPSKPAHLIPILSWSSWGDPFGETQRGHKDDKGFWLDNMIRLQPSEKVNEEATQMLRKWLYGSEDENKPGNIIGGFFRLKNGDEVDLSEVMFEALKKMLFTGSPKPVICEDGLFFSSTPLSGLEEVEIFATASIRWMFGSPGLVRWRDGGDTKYSAGVFAGTVKRENAESLLMV